MLYLLQVVVAPAEKHWQTFAGPEYEGALSGEIRSPAAAASLAMPPGERRFIAHRAMLEIDKPHSIVNLGVGVPEVGMKHPTGPLLCYFLIH